MLPPQAGYRGRKVTRFGNKFEVGGQFVFKVGVGVLNSKPCRNQNQESRDSVSHNEGFNTK